MKKMVLLPYDRYQRLLSESLKATQETVESVHGESAATVSAPPPVDNQDKLIDHFPKQLQSRARTLLRYLSLHVTWNDTGEIVISENVIPRSNIVDLVRVQLEDHKHFRPVGIEAFDKLLTDINVPLSLLNASRREQARGANNIPPPPGIPVKRRKRSTSPVKKNAKWLKL